MNEPTYALETRALTKLYGKNVALRGIDLAVKPATIFGVIGPNGAGKTTTIRILLDIIRPSAGSAEVLGQNPQAGGSELRRQIGYLPGELRLDGRLTGATLLRYYESISGPVAPGAIAALARRLDLDLDRQVRTLSKGNKQKLGLVQAFMHQPRLLVLDEPTSGLDPLVQQEFLAMVREARHNGQTVFLSSHVLSEIQQAADEVAILREGRIITVSDVDSLRETAVRKVRVGIAGASISSVQAAFAGIPQLSQLVVNDEDRVRVEATLEGDIDPFVKAIAGFTVSDLAVEEPDLEQSVLRLYSVPARSPKETLDEK